MAWNPKPEVAVARDAAKRLSAITKTQVDRVVVLFTNTNGNIGYASYGDTAVNCGKARRLADRLFDVAMEVCPDDGL